MSRRSALLLILVALGGLSVASASGDPSSNTFTAAIAPTSVTSSSLVAYAFQLTNRPSSDSARQAKIAIPFGFDVESLSIKATTSAAGSCSSSTWIADGALLADGKINLKWPGESSSELCSGGVLMVTFRATSPTAEGPYAWTPELFRDSAAFTLKGALPTVTVDATPPDTTIVSGPPNPSSSPSASFEFSSSETGSTFQCSLDGAVFANCSSPTSYSGLAEGPHTFQVRATDPADNTDPSPAAYSWTVAITVPDRTPPGNVTGLVVSGGDDVVTLSWTLPIDLDLAHVLILRSEAGAAAVPIYLGKQRRYADLTVKNGVRYFYTLVSYDLAGNASGGVTVAALPRVLLLAPRHGARVTSPPLLVWKPVPVATYYNVQLFKLGAKKVLSAWPRRARLKLRLRWVYQGRRYRLKPGVYRWYVWPGFGARSENRYGELLGQSTFVVAAPRA